MASNGRFPGHNRAPGPLGTCQTLQGGLRQKKNPKPYPKIRLFKPKALQGGLRQKKKPKPWPKKALFLVVGVWEALQGGLRQKKTPKPDPKIGLLTPPGRPATEKHRKHVQNLDFSRFLGLKWVEKKVEIEGVGPIWRAPG